MYENVKFRTFHVVDSKGMELGRVTMATAKHEEEAHLRYVAFSYCSPKDGYVKRKGQLIANGRLHKVGKRMLTYVEKLDDLKTLLIANAERKKIKWMEGVTINNIK